MKPWERDYAAPVAEPAPEAAGPAPWERQYAGPAPKEPKSGNVLKRAVMGAADLAAGAGKYGSYILAPYDLAADAVTGKPLGTGHRERMRDIEGFARDEGADDWTSVVNQSVPELVGTAGPLAKVEGAVVKEVAKRMLPRAVGKPLSARAAGVAADIGTNAAYSAAQAGAEGQDMGDAALNAALISGGVRAGVSTALSPFRKGLRQPVDKNAKMLQDAGMPVTPGMLYPGSWVAAGERGARNTPFVGGSVEAAEGRLGREYIRRYAQEAVDPLQRVVPGETIVPPRAAAEPAAAAVERPRALPRATSTEVGPSMVEPITGRPAMIAVDSAGNAGQLSTAVRQADEVGSGVGPFTRDTVEGQGPTRAANEAPAGAAPETFDQQFRMERRAPQVEGEGLDLVRNVQKHIDDSYNDVVDHTFMKAGNGVSALLQSTRDLDNISWLTKGQRARVKGFVNDRLIQRIQGLGPDAVLSGREVKNLDAMLGEQARGFAEDATTKPMSDALYAIQHRLRVATEGVTPQHRHALQLSNESFRKALPLIAATEKSLGTTGIPSALQLRRAMEKYNIPHDAINDAMVQVAPNAPTSNQINRRWIGSGLGLTSLLTGGLGGAAGFVGGAGLAGGLGKMAYSPAGVKAQLAMLRIPAAAKRIVDSLPLQEQIKYLQSYAGQTGARLGENNAP